MNGKEKNKYRTTKEWKDKRKQYLKEINYTCEICNTRKKKGLHIHHINEDAYGHEKNEDIIGLCATCHKTIEWLLSRTKNPVDINKYCENLKNVYIETKRKKGNESS